MMKIRVLLICLLMLLTENVTACLRTHQFRIFPIGFKSDTLITIDMHIWQGGMGISEFPDSTADFWVHPHERNQASWKIKTYLSYYDKYQIILETKAVDSAFFL